MKKYLIILVTALVILTTGIYLYFYNGELFIPEKGEITCMSSAAGSSLYIDRGKGMQKFEIRGVNMGQGKPAYFATDLALTREEYLHWFRQIQDMGANVIRIYTIASPDFYNAFYEYNAGNPDPLYLIHGVWVNDYLINSGYSAFDQEFYRPFLRECKKTVDVIHGRFNRQRERHIFSDRYRKDISQWVYGYILGIEWEGDLVVFTNDCLPQAPQYQGKYLYTENARNFEIFLAGCGDKVIQYETEKYGMQHAVAFANWPTTCPLEFPEIIKQANKKYGKIDVENIKATSEFGGGLFASYHIYPYYPEYVLFEEGGEKIENTYREYLTRLNSHHSIPVVISEFGVPASRGMASYEKNRELGRDQGMINEQEQGQALVSLYKDIRASGCAGGIVFSWQDEWFKRTWNTIPTVDLENIIYWSDPQTNEQRFGLLSFDPGAERRMCYIDGDREEWTEGDVFLTEEGITLSVKYDLEGMYLLIEKPDLDLENDNVYIPIDLTPKSGARTAENLHLSMSDYADFIIHIHGKQDSRVWVQARYNTCAALFGAQLKYHYNPYFNPPEKDSPTFEQIHLILHELNYHAVGRGEIPFTQFNFNDLTKFYTLTQHYETGKLRYGNGNPDAEDFDSLADFCAGDGFVEIRIPWQLLNFADPTHMKIHDDYYEVHGVEYLSVNHMNIGVGDGNDTIQMEKFPLKPLGRKPEYHERLKKSYYILQDYWTNHPTN